MFLAHDSLYAIILFMGKDQLSRPKNVKFDDLLKICTEYFGNPRIIRKIEGEK